MGNLFGGPGHFSRRTLQDILARHRQQSRSISNRSPSDPIYQYHKTTVNLADLLAYKNDDANTQRAWEVLNPNDKYMNHRPTDAAIKSSVMLALGSSSHHTRTSPNNTDRTTTPIRPGTTCVWTSKATSPKTPLGPSKTPTFRCANVNERPAIGDAPHPALTSHPH